MDKGVKEVVITLGSLGAFAMNQEKSELVKRLSVEAIDTTVKKIQKAKHS